MIYEYTLIIYRELEGQGEFYRFRVLLINDSDINFYGIFSKLAQNTPINYLLIGSCGSSTHDDLVIVNEAGKGDHGKLEGQQRFVWDQAKTSSPYSLTGKGTGKCWEWRRIVSQIDKENVCTPCLKVSMSKRFPVGRRTPRVSKPASKGVLFKVRKDLFWEAACRQSKKKTK